MPLNITRDVVFQPFSTQVLAVQITPTALIPTATKADLIDSFVISLDAGAANNIFLGDQGVTVNSGIEVVAGAGPLLFRIRNQNIQYDVHSIIDPMAENTLCQQIQPRSIPFIIWDMTQIYAVAVAITNIRIAPFRSQFI